MQELFEIGELEPTIGRTTGLGTSSWEAVAVYHPELFADSLYALGLSDDDVARALTSRDDIVPEVQTIDEWEVANLTGVSYLDGGEHVRREAAARRGSAFDRLHAWLRGREIREQESTQVNVNVPLWTFSSPVVQGCSATVEHAQKRGTALSFDVLVAGSGLGSSAEYHTSTMWTFHASEGHVKVIFVSATLRVAHVLVIEQGRPTSEGFRVDASESTMSEPAVLLLPASARLSTTDVAREFPLAKDTTGDIAEYRYMYEKQNRKSFGIDISALGVGASVKSSVEIAGSLALTYQLRGGFDYELRYLREGHGVVWSLPAPPV